MYFIDFFKKVFKLKNIGIIIWMVINLFIIIGFFPSTKAVTNASGALVTVIRGVVIYAVSVALALSPIGEVIFRAMNGCREISDPSMLNRLTPLFNEVYEKAKLKDPNLSQNIRLYIVDQPYPNAFALGRNTVCVTSGLLYLSDDEIKGIFAHEFAHLSNKDTDITLFIYVGNLIASVMFLILRVVLFIISFFLGSMTGRRNSAARGFVLAATLDLIYATIVGLYTKLGILLVNYSNRNHEFEADKFAYNLGYGRELRDALTELQGENVKPSGFVANLMSSHPETYLRIEKLNKYLSEIFNNNSSRSVNESSNRESDTDTFDKFEKNEINYSTAGSNETIDQSANNGITFINDDITNIEKKIKNINYQKFINKNTKAPNINIAAFNKEESSYSSVNSNKQPNTATFSKNNNTVNVVKNSYQKTENKKINTISNSIQKNNNKMFYMGLFILSFGGTYLFIPIALFVGLIHPLAQLCGKLGLYKLLIILYDISEIINNIMRVPKIFYQIDISMILLILLIIMLVLIIVKLIKENRIGELKRVNYLSAIIGCCLWIYNRMFFYGLFGSIIPIFFMTILLLISTITNGILVFREKKNNKKY
jgi:peptidase M48 ste24p